MTEGLEPVVCEQVTRTFGSVRALDGFDMSLPRGKVVALVGPNGAGKTTLLLILAGLLEATSGSVRVEGADPATHAFSVHRSVGWMPDFFGVYDDLSATEYLELFGAAFGLERARRSQRARELLGIVGLGEFIDRKVHTMSRGQKQRLGFARTLVHEPTILLLDEPASGLDPRARIDLRELVRRQAAEGATVLVSSHILSELEEMADLVVFADAGKSRGMFSLAELPAGTAARSWTILALDPDRLRAALSGAPEDVSFLPNGAAVVPLAGDEEANELLVKLVRDGVRISSFAPAGGGLEDAFMSFGETRP